MTETQKYINTALTDNGITVSDDKTEKLAAYLDELLRVNTYMNLTAVRDPQEAAVINIADCCACAKYIPENARLLDVGSGAGLPAFPFAIMRPDISVTALDSTGKKVNFISDTARLLGMNNLSAVCGRAEELAAKPEYREKFTAVSARAVARLNILSELCLPFLEKSGLFIAMKSRLADEELDEAGKGIKILGGRVKAVDTFTLNGSDVPLSRTIILTEKVCHTPGKYPRRYKSILSAPL